MSIMGLPKKLTEMQIKFAQLLVTNEGRKTPTECAIEAGYAKERATITASELQSPKKYPLVVKYIGEIRDEYNSSGWKFNTRPGYICIFPGQVEHYSTPHQGDKDRIIIGANFFVESALGDYNNTDRMILNVSVK